ncbi:hypothetical protein, partial [Enterococcus mundtii]|uniref:hypothetical protein n=1 Tax=Enterococcus mundtii TaxID=53346 RepID=UPI0035C73C59
MNNYTLRQNNFSRFEEQGVIERSIKTVCRGVKTVWMVEKWRRKARKNQKKGIEEEPLDRH